MTGGASRGSRGQARDESPAARGHGGCPRPSSSVSCGSNATHECRRTAASTRTDTPRSQTSRRRSAPTSHRQSGCWRSSGRPLATPSATAAWSTVDAGRQRAGAGVRAATSGLGPGLCDRGLEGGPGLGEIGRLRTGLGHGLGLEHRLSPGARQGRASPRRTARRSTRHAGPPCSPCGGSDPGRSRTIGPSASILRAGPSARRSRSPVRPGRSRARRASGSPSGCAATTSRGSRRGRRRAP